MNDRRKIFFTGVLCCFAYSDLHVHLSQRQPRCIETGCVSLNILPKMFRIEMVELN